MAKKDKTKVKGDLVTTNAKLKDVKFGVNTASVAFEIDKPGFKPADADRILVGSRMHVVMKIDDGQTRIEGTNEPLTVVADCGKIGVGTETYTGTLSMPKSAINGDLRDFAQKTVAVTFERTGESIKDEPAENQTSMLDRRIQLTKSVHKYSVPGHGCVVGSTWEVVTAYDDGAVAIQTLGGKEVKIKKDAYEEAGQ